MSLGNMLCLHVLACDVIRLMTGVCLIGAMFPRGVLPIAVSPFTFHKKKKKKKNNLDIHITLKSS